MRSLLAFFCVLFTAAVPSGAFTITEFMALNGGTVADAEGEFDDWIEIMNTQAEARDLGGHYLSNDREDPALWQVPPDTVIPPQGRLLIWLDNDPEQGAVHAPFRLRGSGGVILLTGPDGETVLDEIDFPAQHPDVAFGRASPDAETLLFLLKPTPGEANDPTGVSTLGGVIFSRPAGVFSDPFELTLSTETEGGIIRYSTNGKEPSIFNSKKYSEPISISESTCLRAHVMVGGQVVSPLVTQIYLAVDEEVANFDSNLPVVLVDSRGYDFSRDSALNAGFPQSPVCSIFFETGEDGRASIAAEPQHVGRAGMNVRGASSRGWPKKQYKFETWGEADEDRDVSLLGLPADADWILAAPYFDKSLIRNEITFRWWEKLGYYSPRTRFLELFVDMNGDGRVTMEDYEGVYVLTEKIKSSPDRLAIKEDSFILEATNVNQHWTSARGIRLKYVEPRENEEDPDRKEAVRLKYNQVEQAVLNDDFDDPVVGYRQHLAVPSHVDYDIMRELSRNIDGASTFLSLDDEGKVQMGPLWDYNQSYGLTRLFDPVPGWRTDGWNDSYMSNGGHWMKWWGQLKEDPEYQLEWEDRWVALRESIFTNEALLDDINGLEAQLEEGAARNFERWDSLGKVVWATGGSTRADPGESERDTYAKEIAFIRDWLVARLEWIDSQVRSPPSFHQNGGAVADGFALEMGEGMKFKPFGGRVHYTLDGSDPRAPGGALSDHAVAYDGPVLLTEDSVVSARMRSIFGRWSTLRRASFLVGVEPPSADNLTVSELHYNPEGSDDLEFIELVNRGSSAIDLTGVHLRGAVEFTFPTVSLQPDEVILVVEDREAFLAHYDIEATLVAGQWTGALRNSGEELEVVQLSGERLFAFAYDDAEGWPAEADGDGYSLERVSLGNDNLSDADAWRRSALAGGSPGQVSGSGEPQLTYEVWRVSIGEDWMGGPGEDPDEDGYANVIEFALGTSPTDRSARPRIDVRASEGGVEIEHASPSGREVEVVLEVSTDLIEWTKAGEVTREDLGERVTWSLNEAAASGASYFRLRVSG